MPYTEEQLHDMMNIEGPPTIRQLALQNLQHQEKDAAAAPAAVPATMLGQESDEESEGEEFFEGDQAPPASPEKEAVALHDWRRLCRRPLHASPSALVPDLPLRRRGGLHRRHPWEGGKVIATNTQASIRALVLIFFLIGACRNVVGQREENKRIIIGIEIIFFV